MARERGFRAALIAVLLVGGSSLVRQVLRPIPGDGVRWQTDRDGLVARTAGADGQVRPGDRLRTIDGRPVTSRLDLVLLDRGAAPGAHREYAIERDGVAATIDSVVAPGKPARGYLFLALVGLAAAAASLRLAARREEASGAGIAAAAAAALALTALASPVGWMDGWDRAFVVADEAARLALPALLLHATLAGSGSSRRPRLTRALYAPGVALAVADLAFFARSATLPAAEVVRLGAGLDRAIGIYLALAVAGSLLLTLEMLRAGGCGRLKPRSFLLALGAGLGPYVALVALPRAFGLGSALAGDLSLLPLTIVPLAWSSAFLGRPPGADEWLQSALRFATGLLLALGIAVAAGAVLASVLPALGLPAWLGFALVALLALAGTLDGLRGAVATAIERALDRDAFEARRTMVRFGRDLAIETRVDRIAAALGERVSRAFRVGTVALYVRPAGEEDLLLAGSNEGEAVLPVRLAAAEIPAPGPSPGVVVRLGEGAGVSASLSRAGLELGVPLVARGRTVGLLALGRPGLPLGRDLQALLADLAGYAAVAIENSRLNAELASAAEALREQEAFRSAVIESLDIGILIVDLEGRVLSCNRAFRGLVGREVVPAGAAGAAVVPPELLDPPREGGCERRALGDRTVALAMSLLQNAAGQVRGRILVVEDVTAQVGEEEERIRREKLASVGLLSAGIAHQVNTPLAGVASYVQMLIAATPATDPRRPLLDKVEKQAFRAARIVQSLLNFARSRDEAEAVFDLNEVATEAVSLLEHETRKKSVHVDLRLDTDLPAVSGRPGEMEQVVLNLAKNAIDAVPAGGTLRLVTASAGGDVLLRVEDGGCGIAPDNLKRLFDPFFTTKGRGHGHGLGLGVAQGIVRGHGGEIGIESEVGEGTRVTVRLPAAAAGVKRAASGGAGAR